MKEKTAEKIIKLIEFLGDCKETIKEKFWSVILGIIGIIIFYFMMEFLRDYLNAIANDSHYL